MNWSTFVEDYNELTALSFDHLYHFGKEDEDLEIFLFQHPYRINWIKYYYTYDIDHNYINFQIDIKTSGKYIRSINVYLSEDDKLEYLLREDDFFNRKTLSNINVHKTIFLWIYFLMLINGFNHKFVRLL